MKKVNCKKCGKEKFLNITCLNCDKSKNLAFSIFFIIVAFYTLSLLRENNSPPKEKEYSKIEAYSYAEQSISNNLKAPKTAEFPPTSTKNLHVKQINKNEFVIDSWVDSQNSFGALIRTKFSCRVIFINDKIKVENINFY